MLETSYFSKLAETNPAQMVREEGASSLTRGMGPNVFRSILMNASQLASYVFLVDLSWAVV
jgi:hypothetical protein